ncbi:uncharacterized protein MONOS_10165 [Monocercomonoides exilis]|uniref:uncharacterized protein n=1 Tax=Monocercomonoides exilis TaxID=2049356 RepID=UPI003559CEC5|nr:hypothetical protein MONOS_10165 [Monocercomonoides exilis]|eukprot:MONOS_10165.1-p1 / transcript=MONOS_10165.1 / gene=MONOS_10165 / organism=Monocercomonoides_exilis_PA203 / gene_product=unspecified product / transcript_product=unspecified product / location=Mono_scaffold00450:36412-37636(+) / protein_length=313 / sequence_SO=supercontig / SO=protein_coding / is_pseudo=false
MVEEKSNGCQMQLHNRLRQMVEQAYLTKEQTTFSQPDGQPPRSSFSFTSSGKTSAFLKSPTLSDQVGLPIILVIDNSSYASYFSTSSEMSLSVFREEAESVFLPRLRARALRLGAAVTLCLTEHRDNSILLHMIALCHSAMYNLRRSEQISELTRRASGDLQSLFLPFGCDTPDAVISKQRIFDSGSLPSSSTSSDSTSSSDPSSPPTSLISPEAYKAAFSVTNSLFRSEILPSALPAFSMPLEGNGAFTDSGVRKKGRMMEYPAPLSKDVPADEQTFLASLLATEAPSPPPPKNPKAFFEQMLSSSHNIRK